MIFIELLSIYDSIKLLHFPGNTFQDPTEDKVANTMLYYDATFLKLCHWIASLVVVLICDITGWLSNSLTDPQ